MQRKMLIAAISGLTVGGVVLATALPALAVGDKGRGAVAFEYLDADKSGSVTLEEFQVPAAERFNKIDANADGALSEDEMRESRKGKCGKGRHGKGFMGRFGGSEEARAERAKRMIEVMDADGDGLLSQAELAEGPSSERIFSALDTDNNGTLSQEEFEAAKKQFMKMRKGAAGSNEQ